jgi:hypothetical protein
VFCEPDTDAARPRYQALPSGLRMMAALQLAQTRTNS